MGLELNSLFMFSSLTLPTGRIYQSLIDIHVYILSDSIYIVELRISETKMCGAAVILNLSVLAQPQTKEEPYLDQVGGALSICCMVCTFSYYQWPA